MASPSLPRWLCLYAGLGLSLAVNAQGRGFAFTGESIAEYFGPGPWRSSEAVPASLPVTSRLALPLPRNFSGLESQSPFKVSQPDVLARRASYPIDTESLRIVPAVIYLPDSGARVPGAVLLGIERQAAPDPFTAKAQLGWSGKPGGSFELGYRLPERQVTVKGDERPLGATVIPNGRAPGNTLDGRWYERIGERTTATIAVSSDRLDLDGRDPEAASGRLEVRHRATDQWSFLTRFSGASYSDVAAPELRWGTAAIGTAFEAGGLGLTVVYRDEENSAATRTGHGGRVSFRSTHGRWSAAAYADVQQRATTLELDVRGQPDLPAEMTALGLVAASPENTVQLLRDRGAVFAEHGITVGALRVDPLRRQGGLDVRWRDSRSGGSEVGMRLVMDDVEGSAGTRRALLGTLFATWRVLGDTDVMASYASLSTQRDLQEDSQTLFRIAVRAGL